MDFIVKLMGMIPFGLFVTALHMQRTLCLVTKQSLLLTLLGCF